MQKHISQLSLWGESQPVILHQHMELLFEGGERQIVCCADTKPRQYRKDNIYAGFVGGAVMPEQCPICNPQKSISS